VVAMTRQTDQVNKGDGFRKKSQTFGGGQATINSWVPTYISHHLLVGFYLEDQDKMITVDW
jgi:hypothetical protein